MVPGTSRVSVKAVVRGVGDLDAVACDDVALDGVVVVAAAHCSAADVPLATAERPVGALGGTRVARRHDLQGRAGRVLPDDSGW